MKKIHVELWRHFLSFKGIRYETANVMLLYAYEDPAIIANAYVQR